MDNFTLVGRESYNLTRTMKKTIYIRANDPSLNRGIGKYHLSPQMDWGFSTPYISNSSKSYNINHWAYLCQLSTPQSGWGANRANIMYYHILYTGR